jgi:hypothetical protein
MCIVKNCLSLYCSSVCFYFDSERLQRKWFPPGKKQMAGSLVLDPLTMVSGRRICSRQSLTRTSFSRTLLHQACSLQLRPRSEPAGPTTSRTMLLGCLLGTDAHALATATTRKGTAATAWCFVRAAVHMVQHLPPLLGVEHAPHSQSKSREEEAMVGGCVWVCCRPIILRTVQGYFWCARQGQTRYV